MRAYAEDTEPSPVLLDALKKSLTGTEKTVILDQDSELAQILAGN